MTIVTAFMTNVIFRFSLFPAIVKTSKRNARSALLKYEGGIIMKQKHNLAVWGGIGTGIYK